MRLRTRTQHNDVELNITTFMNLMVVLIPFLLLNAVFAQVAVLKLNLPADKTGAAEESAPPVTLVVEVHGDHYAVGIQESGALTRLPNGADGKHDSAALHQALVALKAEHPSISDITLLCAPHIRYALLVDTLDATRYQNLRINGQSIRRALFPDIGMGALPSPGDDA